MFNKANAAAKYRMIIIPEGSSLPEDLQHLFHHADDIIEKISASTDKAIIVSINTRELQLLVEYRDLFDAEPTAVIGLQGAMYSTVWNTYVATMERITLDSLRARLREENDSSAREGSDAVTRPSRADRVGRLNQAHVYGQQPKDDSPDESEFGAT